MMAVMIVNRSKPAGAIVPSLIYRDLGAAITWLCDVFGFAERLRITGPDGRVGHAQLNAGAGGILLGEARTEGGLEFRPPRPEETSVALTVHVADVDAHYAHAKQRGARNISEPATYPYGERQYSAFDLEGHRWAFSQSVADARPEDWGAVAKDAGYPCGLLPRPRWCYFEIPALDLARSVAFYENVFGWNIRGRDSGRPSFDDATGNISGAWVTGRPASRTAGLLPYIWVDSIDATVALVQESGGEIVQTPHRDAPEGEWIATFRDPAGNLMGLYQEGSR
jgi:uncharacterized glyoxalase superfamily protein PhnB